MTLTPEEQALLDARREMLRAGEALDAAYAALRSTIATTGTGTLGALSEALDALTDPAIVFDVRCRAYDAAYRAAYDRSKP